MMIGALMNIAKFRNVDIEQVCAQMIKDSSAGVRGWADAEIGDWHKQAKTTHDPRGLVRDDHPPLTMAGQEVLYDQDGTSQPPESKPLRAPQDSAEVRQRVMGVRNPVRDRLSILKQRARNISRGGKPVGVVKIGDGGKHARGVLDEWWRADRAG